MPLEPPDPQQWTFVDDFNRAFLGPDYTATPSVNIVAGELRFGPMNLYNNNGQPNRLFAPLITTRWDAPHVQVQCDWRYVWDTTQTGPPPRAGLELVGASKSLTWDGAYLHWGNILLPSSPVGAAALPLNTLRRLVLTVDLSMNRVQILDGDTGVVDTALPDDWEAAMGGHGQVRLLFQGPSGAGPVMAATVFMDNVAVRAGDGTADLSTTTLSSGGVRLGGELRFAPGLPDDLIGSDGDAWFRTDGTGWVYQKQAGHYVQVTQLLGAPGPVGPQGPQGAQGETGPAGKDGADGQAVGWVASPLLFGDAMVLTFMVSDGPYSLAGYELFGVDGAPVVIESSTDGVVFEEVAYPFTVLAGTWLRLTRTDESGIGSTLRARVGRDNGGGGSTPAPFTVQTDSDGFQTIPEGEVTTDEQGYQTITNGTATPDSDGYQTVERSTP